jgi:hypothetical protein
MERRKTSNVATNLKASDRTRNLPFMTQEGYVSNNEALW